MELKEPPKLRGLTFPREKIEQARKQNKLLSIGLETSRACNLRCIYCYAESGRAAQNELTTEELMDIVDQAVDLGAENIRVLGGEPLIDRDIFPFLEHIIQRGATPVVFTNGILLGDDKRAQRVHKMSSLDLAKRLEELGITIIAKINFPIVGKDHHDYNRYSREQDWLNGNIIFGSYDMMANGIKNLMEAGFNRGKPTRLGVESIIYQWNHGQPIWDLWRWMRQNNIYPYIEMTKFAGRAQTHFEMLSCNPVCMEGQFKSFLLIDQAEFGYTWTPKPPMAAASCSQHYYSVYIDAQGNVQPCSSLDIKAGNIREQPLEAIMDGQVIRQMRELPENLEGACKSCDEYCYGCRGNVYQLTGNVFAADPTCWHNQPLHFNEELMKRQLRSWTMGKPNQDELVSTHLRKFRREYDRWQKKHPTIATPRDTQ